IRPRAQRRKHLDARRDPRERGRSHEDRRRLAGRVDARAPIYTAAREDSRPGAANPMKRAELERLIDIIVDELASEMNAGSGGGRPTLGPTNPFGPVRYETPAVRCRCHAVVETCCPDRLQGVLAAGASRVGVHAAGGAPAGVAALIDHTLLRPDATRHDIETLCREAAQFAVATVCVNPTWVRFAAERLSGTDVGVCSVVGFPLGATTGDVKAYEARRAIFDGAREIDMVINVGALKSGDLRQVERDVESVTSICRDCAALSKVIIEA